jgi:hypothetical protein
MDLTLTTPACEKEKEDKENADREELLGNRNWGKASRKGEGRQEKRWKGLM